MHRFIRIVVLVAVCLSVAVPGTAPVRAANAGPTALAAPAADPRLVVFEAFLRPNGCANSKAAAPEINRLAADYADENVLFLEYNPDSASNNRLTHFFAAQGGGSAALPLVMVESGFRYTAGYHTNFYGDYAEMIDTVQSLQAMVGLSATWEQVDDNANVYVTVLNTSGIKLTKSNAHLHLIVYAEEAREDEAPFTHLTNRYVLGDYQYTLAVDKGAQVSLTKTLEPIDSREWADVKILALVDYLQANGTYFSLQAAVATPEAQNTTVSVDQTSLNLVLPVAETSTYTQTVHIAAPKSYTWAVTVNAARPAAGQSSGVSWLEVSPTNGTGPGTLVVSFLSSNMGAGRYLANLVLSSSGSLFDAITIPVTATKTSVLPVHLPVLFR